METATIDLEKEKHEILNAYRGLLRACKKTRGKEDTRLIRKAFNVALEAHKDMRRKSGEPYIYHPIAVARIAAEEIGLGPTSIMAALLHDTVEDTDMTLADINNMFGPDVERIIDGLTKIEEVFDQSSSLQAENFKKMLLTLSDDVRVILIKLADRLHNMRTLGSMRRDKQLKIASETLFLYAPMAHRLGLYSIKSDLEDLSLKFKEPEVYQDIENRLKKGEEVRKRFIRQFTLPIRRSLEKQGFEFEVKGRPKSVFSIWNKMQNKNIQFEEVYDVFAIRIVINTPEEREKADCWKAYSIVTDHYQPNPDRLRDWISTPRANGYESLHTTVMSPSGKWVEVQIRTARMDEVAEKGFAAHWKYKGEDQDHGLDEWLNRIREMLDDPEGNALDFVDDFKLNLFSDEVFVFTPNGDLRTLPKGATALDFAFEIHSQVGSQCIGAKVNHKLVPLSQELRSGDQIEILTSKKQNPKSDWLNYVITAKARSKIKSALNEEKRKIAAEGKEMVQRKLNALKATMNSENVRALEDHYKVAGATELYLQVARGKAELKKLKGFKVKGGKLTFPKSSFSKPMERFEAIVKKFRGSDPDQLVIGDDMKNVEYTLAQCCNPISGDDVFGFVTVSEGIKVHRVNCPNAVQLMSNYAYRIIKARWKGQEELEFLTGIRFGGIDDVGLVNKLTDIISKENGVNMQSIRFDSNDGIFDGRVMAFVNDTDHLNALIAKLKKVRGVRTVERIEN